MPGLYLSFTDQTATSPSLLQFGTGRQWTAWVWSHADSDGSSTQDPMMQVDSANRLNLFPPPGSPGAQTSGSAAQATVVLDPSVSGTSRIPGTVSMPGTILVNQSGDLSMGSFTSGTAPQ